MELAGLKVVMEADFSEVYSGLSQANSMFQNFAQTIRNVFNGIPNLGSRLNFTQNGASQAAQDAREYARAAREAAEADKARIQAQILQQREQDRQNNATRNTRDEYGQLVAANQALVREYYNAAAAVLKHGDASGITAQRLEELRKAAKDGQDQLKKIEEGVGRFQRNVGNYASGFSPLNNSINQITREMPAFANSLQTGFMAISNNLAPLADALASVKREVKLAREEAAKLIATKSAEAEASALAAGATAAEAKAEAKLAGALAVANPEVAQAALAARAQAEAAALAANMTLQQAKAAGILAAEQVVANSATTAAPSVMGKLAAAVFSWQTALSVGITLLTVYGPKLVAFITGTTGATEAKKRLKEQTDALNNAERQSYQNAGEQIGRLRALQATMTNQELTMRQRTIAYNEAVKLYPAYLKQVSKDEALNGGLADTIQTKLIPAIIAASRARAYQEKINILTARQIELEGKADELNKSRTKSQNELKQATKEYGDAVRETAPSEMETGLDANSSAMNKAAGSVERYTKELNDNSKERIKIKDDLDKMTKGLNKYSAKTGDLNPYNKQFDKAPKEVKTVTDVLEELRTKNAEVDRELSSGAIKVEELLTRKIANYRSYISGVTNSKFNLDLNNEEVAKASAAITEYSKTLDNLKRNERIDEILQGYNAGIGDNSANAIDGTVTRIESIKQALTLTLAAKKEITKADTYNQFGSFLDILTTKVISLNKELNAATLAESLRQLDDRLKDIDSQVFGKLATPLQGTEQKISAVRNEIVKLNRANADGSKNKAIEELQKQIDGLTVEEKIAKINDAIKDGLKSTLSQTVDIIAEGVANLGQEGFGNLGTLFAKIGSVLGDQIINLGKQLIISGGLMEAIWKAIEGLGIPTGGPVAIAIGAGAIVAGAAIKAALANQAKGVGKSKKFAAGGIVSGPTNALIGEYAGARGNPEVVAPLSKLTSILRDQGIGQGGQHVFIPEYRIQGQDLLIIMKRAEKYYNR